MADRDNYRGYGNPSGRYYEGREYERGYNRDRSRDRDEPNWLSGGRDDSRHRGEDRGFFEKAGDEIRSWFNEDDDQGRDEWRGQPSQDRHRGYGWGGMMSGRGGRERDFRQDASEPWGGGDRGGRFEDRGGYGTGRAGYGSSDYGRTRDLHSHDANYSEWRRQQIDALDRDYDEYRRENRDKFHSEFSTWRGQRQQQRSSMQQVREHMDVIGTDGEHVGTVDKVSGDRIILTKSDASAGGHHHSIPCSWIQSVDERVTINKTAGQAQNQWRDEETRRALFEREDRRSDDGPHMLNRSFSGTYEER